MILVIRAIQVVAVPAGRKHEFEADTIQAVGIKIILGGEVVADESSLRRTLAVVEAVESDGTLGKITLGGLVELGPEGLGRIRLGVVHASDGIVAAETITCNHVKALGKGGDVTDLARIRVQEIVTE